MIIVDLTPICALFKASLIKYSVVNDKDTAIRSCTLEALTTGVSVFQGNPSFNNPNTFNLTVTELTPMTLRESSVP